MKSEKGITLVSVIIYVIAMLIIVTVVSVITSYFYKNINVGTLKENLNQEYTKFNSFFIEEVNRKGNKIIEIGEVPNKSR